MILLNHPSMNNFVRYWWINFINFDYKEAVVESIRGFKVKGDYLQTFRIQTPTPMLAMLALRLTTFDRKQFNEITRK